MNRREFERLRGFGMRMVTESDGAQKTVAKVALFSGGKLCMGKRNDNGAYTQPGGHVEDGETPLDGMIRECYEETGIELEPSELKLLTKKAVEDHQGNPIEVHAYKAEVDSKRTTTKEDPDGEVSKWEWLDVSDGLPDHVASNLHVPGDRDVVLQALGLVDKPMSEADEQPRPAPTPKPASSARPASPSPAKEPAPKAAPAPIDDPMDSPSDDKLDAVKKLHKMADKTFKCLDDMAIFANECGLKDVAAMIGTVEDAFWEMKRSLAKIRESAERNAIVITEDTAVRVSYHDFDKVMHDVMAGKAMFWVVTNLKKIPITGKAIKKFAASGYTLLAKDKDGKGFRLQQGKNTVYVMPSSLWQSPPQ